MSNSEKKTILLQRIDTKTDPDSSEDGADVRGGCSDST